MSVACLALLLLATSVCNHTGDALDVGKSIGVGEEALDPKPIIFEGQVNIALLLNLHKPGDDGSVCTKFNPSAVQQLMASLWAAKVLNNQSEPNSTKIGIAVYDTCGSQEVAVRQVMKILQTSQNMMFDKGGCTDSNRSPVIGIVGADEASGLATSAAMLNSFDVPFMIASPSGADSVAGVRNVLVTTPDMASQVKPVVRLLKSFRWNFVHLVTASSIALKEFKSEAEANGVVVGKTLQLLGNHFDQEGLDDILKPVSRAKQTIIVAILSPEELRYVTTLMGESVHNHVVWVVASPALDRHTLQELSPALGPGILLEPHSPELAGFKAFFMNAVTNISSFPIIASFLVSYLEHHHNCSSQTQPKSAPPCHQVSALNMVANYHQEPSVSHVAEAVSALAAALRIVTLDTCQNVVGCRVPEAPSGAVMLNALRKLAYAFRRDLPPELEGARLRFTNSGRVVSIHSHIVFFNGTNTPGLIGWYSDELGVNLDSIPSTLARAQLDTTEYHHMMAERLAAANQSRQVLDSLLPREIIYDIRMERVSHSASVRRAWAATVLALASVGILATAYVLVYVLVRICDDTLIGNQYLGVLLLFSVAALYATCVLFVLPAGEAMCGWRLVVHSCTHALCYGLLLVKVMVIRAMSLLGLGGSVSHANQALTLFFIVALQLAVTVQWWLVAGPLIQVDAAGTIRCSPSHTTFIALHTPAMFVLALACIYSIIARRLHHNDHEGKQVLLVSVVCIPVWVGWAVVHHSASLELQEPAVCAHLITVATVIVLGVFIPKLRAISRQAAAFRHKKLSSKSATTVFTLPTEFGTTAVKTRMGGSGPIREGILTNPTYDPYARFPSSFRKSNESFRSKREERRH